jgi:cytidylate kinase
VAECLAERLGSRCLAREILSGAARKLGASEETVQAKFEATPGLWERMRRERERYVLAVQTSLVEACLKGSLVYHGLAGQFLLRGLRGVVRVRLISPLERRVRSLMDSQHRMTAKAAEEFIRNVDQDRRRWVKLTYGADVEDPSLYDLTVNLRWLSVESTCVAIAEAAAQPEYAITDAVESEWTSFAAECHRRLDALGSEA